MRLDSEIEVGMGTGVTFSVDSTARWSEVHYG
jgi:hypothetical protein